MPRALCPTFRASSPTISSASPKRFWVGNREFDPVNVGYVDKAEGNGSWFDTNDNGGFGNSRLGHDYGNASFDHEKRMALVAYMKTL